MVSNWWNGGMRSTPCFHNIVGILTETASGRYATPVEVTEAQLPGTLASGENATRIAAKGRAVGPNVRTTMAGWTLPSTGTNP